MAPMQNLRRPAAVAVLLAVAIVLGAAGLRLGGARAPAATPPPGADAGVACGLTRGRTHAVAVTVAGQGTRTARVHLPAHGPRNNLPLVIALHGAYGNGAFMERYSGFSRLAERDGFAVVYPDARGNFWTLSPGKGPDDVAFVKALLDRLEAGGCIDKTRVYAAGVSNGGGLTARLGCELSGRLAAVAAVAGGYGDLPECRPDHRLSVLEIHGTADAVVPYHAARGDVLEWLQRWVARDGCRPTARRSAVVARVRRYTWSGCRMGSAVEHLAIAGGTHAWPGADPPDPGPPVALSASVEAWRFFSHHRRTGEVTGNEGGRDDGEG
jgi:polyhydroxybutyrate depolymerase